jgi:hypothetical protein
MLVSGCIFFTNNKLFPISLEIEKVGIYDPISDVGAIISCVHTIYGIDVRTL